MLCSGPQYMGHCMMNWTYSWTSSLHHFSGLKTSNYHAQCCNWETTWQPNYLRLSKTQACPLAVSPIIQIRTTPSHELSASLATDSSSMTTLPSLHTMIRILPRSYTQLKESKTVEWFKVHSMYHTDLSNGFCIF